MPIVRRVVRPRAIARGPARPRLLLAAAAVAALSLSVGCDERLSDIAGPSRNLEPKFSSISSLIFSSTDSAGRTACAACHTGRNPATSLDLTNASVDVLLNMASRQKAGATLVIPGDPDGSYLIQKLEGRAGIVGLRMPLNGPPYLTEGQISIIRRWIELGARAD